MAYVWGTDEFGLVVGTVVEVTVVHR
jgi:hypothetical protein